MRIYTVPLPTLARVLMRKSRIRFRYKLSYFTVSAKRSCMPWFSLLTVSVAPATESTLTVWPSMTASTYSWS